MSLRVEQGPGLVFGGWCRNDLNRQWNGADNRGSSSLDAGDNF